MKLGQIVHGISLAPDALFVRTIFVLAKFLRG